MKHLFGLMLITMLLLDGLIDPDPSEKSAEPDLSKNEKLDNIDSKLSSLYDDELFNASSTLRSIIVEIRELVNLLKEDYTK